MSRTISSLLLILLLVPAGLEADDRPNIVQIVSDDQGYGDISCYDHPEEVKTTNLDRIAAAGTRFTNGYSSGERLQYENLNWQVLVHVFRIPDNTFVTICFESFFPRIRNQPKLTRSRINSLGSGDGL